MEEKLRELYLEGEILNEFSEDELDANLINIHEHDIEVDASYDYDQSDFITSSSEDFKKNLNMDEINEIVNSGTAANKKELDEILDAYFDKKGAGNNEK